MLPEMNPRGIGLSVLLIPLDTTGESFNDIIHRVVQFYKEHYNKKA